MCGFTHLHTDNLIVNYVIYVKKSNFQNIFSAFFLSNDLRFGTNF